MSASDYQEPILSVLVLDFNKPVEARACLESVKRHVLCPHRVIYLHNGQADYPAAFLRDGLVDTLIQTSQNRGLGVGTRDLVAACFSPYFLYLQQDQILEHNLTADAAQYLFDLLDEEDEEGKVIRSISLAGPICGDGIYLRARVRDEDRAVQGDGVRHAAACRWGGSLQSSDVA